jgi:hypothetical protein
VRTLSTGPKPSANVLGHFFARVFLGPKVELCVKAIKVIDKTGAPAFDAKSFTLAFFDLHLRENETAAQAREKIGPSSSASAASQS